MISIKYKEIKRFRTFNILERVFMWFMENIDTIMVSTLGAAAISAVALVCSVNKVVSGILEPISSGGMIVSSRYVGSAKTDKAQTALRHTAFLLVTVSSFISILFYSTHKGIISLLYPSIETDVYTNIIIYFKLMILRYPVRALYNYGRVICHMRGDTKTPFILSIVESAVNVIGNTLSLFVFHAGIFGVGLSTLISFIVKTALILIVAHSKNDKLSVPLTGKLAFCPRITKEILYISVPGILNDMTRQSGKVLISSMLSTLPTAHIAAYTVALDVASIITLPGDAGHKSIEVISGRYLGAKKFNAMRVYTKKLCSVIRLHMSIVSVLILSMTPVICKLYHIQAGCESIVFKIILIYAVTTLVTWTFAFCYCPTLDAANDVKYDVTVSLISLFLMRVLGSYIFGIVLNGGAVGLNVGMCLDWSFRAIMYTYRYKSGKWVDVYLHSKV